MPFIRKETTMTKLSDTQSILLSAASQRENLSLHPLPASLTNAGARAKAITGLLKAALIEERETNDPSAMHREDGDIRFGLFVTQSGLEAIGAGDQGDVAGTSAAAPVVPPKPRETKASMLVALLQRDGGATLAEMIDATGWLPHTTRAALAGLRKKGHAITRGKRGYDTCYTIEAAA